MMKVEILGVLLRPKFGQVRDGNSGSQGSLTLYYSWNSAKSLIASEEHIQHLKQIHACFLFLHN